eukprot:2014861-Prymnesium_polylepis.1
MTVTIQLGSPSGRCCSVCARAVGVAQQLVRGRAPLALHCLRHTSRGRPCSAAPLHARARTQRSSHAYCERVQSRAPTRAACASANSRLWRVTAIPPAPPRSPQEGRSWTLSAPKLRRAPRRA